MSANEELSLARFRAPRYWPAWVLMLALKLVARLPFRSQIWLGATIGRTVGPLRRRQRRVARRNLEICFPELDEAARNALLERHFRSLGIAVVEMAIGWYSPVEKLRKLIEIRGREHLEAAQAAGKGVLLVGAHFTTVEVGVALLEDLCERCTFMYRPQGNAMMEVVMRRGRSRFAPEQIPRDNIRALVRKLAENYVVVYLPDQTYLGNQSALLPFFGEPAVTNIALSKLARISGATVLTYFFRRKDDDSGYVVDIGPAFEDFPSDDAAADTRRFVEQLEAYIRLVPDQYLWVYKKYKGRPAPFPDAYARSS